MWLNMVADPKLQFSADHEYIHISWSNIWQPIVLGQDFWCDQRRLPMALVNKQLWHANWVHCCSLFLSLTLKFEEMFFRGIDPMISLYLKPSTFCSRFKTFIFLTKAFFCMWDIVWDFSLIRLFQLKLAGNAFSLAPLKGATLNETVPIQPLFWKGYSLETSWKSLWPSSSRTKLFPLNWLVFRLASCSNWAGCAVSCIKLFENCSLL